MSCPFAKFAAILPVAPVDAKSSFHAHHPIAVSPPSSPPANVAALTLSDALRIGTTRSHRAVEKSRGVALLLHSISSSPSSIQSGQQDEVLTFTRTEYVRFSIMLACIYIALEAALHTAHAHPSLSSLFSDQTLPPCLARTHALLNDVSAHLDTIHTHTGASLEDLADEAREHRAIPSTCTSTAHEDIEDPSARTKLLRLVTDSTQAALHLAASSPTHDAPKRLTSDHIDLLSSAQVHATLTYVSTLLSFPQSKRNPGLLLAHAYTRYLGDLSGGQHIVRKLSKRFPTTPTLNCPSSDGFEFYRFASPTTTERQADLKTRFRHALDTSCMNSDQLVAEANTAFDLNTALFESLLPAQLRMQPPQSEHSLTSPKRARANLQRLLLLLGTLIALVLALTSTSWRFS